VLSVGLLGAVIMYLMTGHGPETNQDYFEPRTGRKDPEGNEERMSLPSYMKDVLSVMRHPIRTVGHKVHPLLSYIADMLQNKDYWDNQIRNPHDPLVVQLKQVAEYTAEQFQPIGFRNLQEQRRRLQTGGRAALPFIGITPANREAVRSPAQNRMHEMLSGRGGSATPEQAQQRASEHDVEAAVRAGTMTRAQAADSLRHLGLSKRQQQGAKKRMREDPRVTSFKHLTLEERRQVYDLGTPEERKLWHRYLKGAGAYKF
jgi:hypothetical protein